ncbi:hypothetical protein ACGFYY_27865 [Streptomyces sp. NPDC048331]|uniref:hypothetical protein n=1 Tax=Streptomyces sp. NPDC048331 TaxID=3365534 RepID=UPI00371ECD0F
MTSTPFRDTAKALTEHMDYIAMQVGCDRARSHSWWRNIVEHGPWKGQQARTAPPTPDEWAGIAKLFGTTEEQVCAMIAADWFGVRPGTEVSARVMQFAPVLDELSEKEAEALGVVVHSMASSAAPQGQAAIGSKKGLRPSLVVRDGRRPEVGGEESEEATLEC